MASAAADLGACLLWSDPMSWPLCAPQVKSKVSNLRNKLRRGKKAAEQTVVVEEPAPLPEPEPEPAAAPAAVPAKKGWW